MPLFARTKTANKKASRKSEEAAKKAKETREELQKPGNAEEKPNIFKRFVSWVKSVFSKEPNLRPGATQSGNINAGSVENAAPRAAVNDTLPAAQTAPDADTAIEPVRFPKPGGTASSSANAAPTGGNSAELPENTPEEAPENGSARFNEGVNVTEDKSVMPENPDNTEKAVVGDITFDIFKIENYMFAQSGTVKVLGKDVRWSSDKKISLVQNEGKYYGSGEITFSADGLSTADGNAVTAEIIVINDEISYRINGGLVYSQDGIKLGLGETFSGLDKISKTETQLLNYSSEGDPPLQGDVTVGANGFEGAAYKDILHFPAVLFTGVKPPLLKLGKNEEKKLALSLGYSGESSDPTDIKLSVGIENVVEIKAEEPVKAEVKEDGKIEYAFSGSGYASLFGKPSEMKFPLTAFNIAMDQGLSAVKIPEFDLEVGGAELKDIALSFSDDGKGKVELGGFSYKDLKISGLSGGFDESGITAGADGFEFPIGDTTLKGTLKGFSWKKDAKLFTVSEFSVAADKFSLGKNITVEGASVKFSLDESGFAFSADGAFAVSEIKTDYLTVSAEELKASFELSKQDKEKAKLAAKLTGSIKFAVGKGEAVQTAAEDISYEDGVFSVKSIALSSELNTLISENFSGTAALTANDLKFSDSVELSSLEASLEKLAYKGKTLVSAAEAKIFLKDGTGEPAKVDDNAKLDAGKDEGMLQNAKLGIYLMNGKKGVQISAQAFNYDFKYLSVGFKGVEAGIFSEGGENKISAPIAELKSGQKLNDLLKAESFALSASECEISSEGVKIGEVTASVSELKLAEALTISSFTAEMKFGENRAFESFEGNCSAMIGNISVSGLNLKIAKIAKDADNANNADNEEKLSATVKADEIACGEDLLGLKITNVEGSYSEGRVNVASANFSFTLGGTNISGELKDLSWSKDADFSVGEMSVKTDKIAVSDSLSIDRSKLSVSVKDKKFSIGAEADLNIGEYSNSLIKIDATELSVALALSADSSGEKSKLSASGSVAGSIGVTFADGIASGKVADIKYEDEEFSVGEFSLGTDLSKLARDLGGNGTISISSLKFKKGAAPSFGKAQLAVTGVTYNSKPLTDSLTAGIIMSGSEAEPTAVGNASLCPDGADGELSGLNVWIYLTDEFKGVKMSAASFKVTPGDLSFVFSSFKGEFGSGGCAITLGEFKFSTGIAKSLGIENLEFTATDAAIKEKKFTVGSVSASANGTVVVYGFGITNAAASVSFNDKWKLAALAISGSLNSDNSITVSGFEVKYASEQKEGGVSAKKISYKSLEIINPKGSIGASGITAGAEKFTFPIKGQTIEGSLDGFNWKKGAKMFTVKNFSATTGELKFGDLVTVKGANVKLSLTGEDFSFLAAGTLSLKNINTGLLTVNAEALAVEFSMGGSLGDKTKDAKADNSDDGISASVKGSITFSVGKDSAVEAVAENISYKGDNFKVETLTFAAEFNKLISSEFSGSAQLVAEGLTFGKTVELGSLAATLKGFAYDGRTIAESASAKIYFKEGAGSDANANDKAELASGAETGILKGASFGIYLMESKKGVQLKADGLDYSFKYVSMSFEKIDAALFSSGNFNIASEKALIHSNEALNSLIGAENLVLTVTDSKITSKGVEIGKVSAEVKALKIANALTLTEGSAELGFNDKKELSRFSIAASAKLGGFSVSGLSLKITENGTELAANEIDCGGALKNLKINSVKGSFSKDKATVNSGKFSFKLADKDFSGALENLSWSREDNFSVEKLTVESGSIQITDGVTVEGGEISASIKDKSFSIGAKAKLAIDGLNSGIIKVNGSELEFGLNISDEKKDDKSSLKIAGSAKGKISVEIGDGIAAADIDSVEYNDGEFTLGSFEARADLARFGAGSQGLLGGSGSVFVNNLKLKKGEKPSVGAMGMKIGGLSYNGKTLVNDLSVNIILDNTVQTEKQGEDTAKADSAELALSGGVSGMLSGLSVSVYLTEGFKGAEIEASSFMIKPGSMQFAFDKFSGKFGSEKGNAVCEMKLGGLSVDFDLAKNPVAKHLGVDGLKFSAENAVIENNKLKLGKVSAEAIGAVKAGGFEINDLKLDVEFTDEPELKSIKVGGTLSYGKYLSGSGAVMFDEKGLHFEDVKSLKASYGCFAGSVDKIIFDNSKEGTFVLQTLELKKQSADNADDLGFEEKQGTLMGKFLRSIPNITIIVKEIAFENGTVKKPSLDDISVSKFNKTFTLLKGFECSIGYSGGEKGEFLIEGAGKFELPKGGKAEEKEVFSADVPIVPGLMAKFGVGFSAALSASASVSLKAARNDTKLNFDTELKAQAKATFGIYAKAALKATALLISIEGGIKGGVDLKSDLNLDGKLGVVYDPAAESFFDAFSVAKDKTSIAFEAGGDVELVAAFYGKIGGLPAIFAGGKLAHSWELGRYKLAGVNIKGAVFYDQDEGCYKFDGDAQFKVANGFDKYSPKHTDDEIAKFGENLSDLQNSMKSVSSLLDKVNSQKTKDSTGEITSAKGENLGIELQDGKQKIAGKLNDLIMETFQKGRENSEKCHILMVNIRRIIEKNADRLAENESYIKEIEEVLAQSDKALEIIGYEGGKDGLTKEKYDALIQNLKIIKNSEEQLNKLAALDPAAVVNMFKALRIDSIVGAAAFRDYAKLGRKSGQKDSGEDKEETLDSVSQIDTRIYGSAMEDLNKVLQDKQKVSDKQDALLEAARKALENAEREKKSLKAAYDELTEATKKKIADCDLEKFNKEEDERYQQRLKELEINGNVRRNRLIDEKYKAIEAARKAQHNKDVYILLWDRGKYNELKDKFKKAEYRKDHPGEDVMEGGYSYPLGTAHAKIERLEYELKFRMSDDKRAQMEAELKIYKAEEAKYLALIEPIEQAYEVAKKNFEDFLIAHKDAPTTLRREYDERLAALPAMLEKEKKEAADVCARNKSGKAALLEQWKGSLPIEEEKYKEKAAIAEEKYQNALLDYKETAKATDFAKQQLAEQGDISTAMLGFKEFVSVEYNRTGKTVEKAREKYARSAEASELSEEQLAQRRAGLVKIIDQVVKEKPDENRLGVFAKNIEKVRGKQEIVDSKMKGHGLSNYSDSIAQFAMMKADDAKFKTMQKQLDEVYGKLNGFHDVMRQALESWNQANGLNFPEAKSYSASELAQSSLEAVSRFDDTAAKTAAAEKACINDTELKKIADDLSRLGNANTPAAFAGAKGGAGQVPAPSQQEDAQRLGA